MLKRLITSLLAAIFLAGSFGLLAGCNTIEGAGRDIEQGGNAIKNEAREQNKR